MRRTLNKPLTKKVGDEKSRTRPKAARGKAMSGVVGYCVYGSVKKVTLPVGKLVEKLRIGLPVTELNDLQVTLAVPMEKLGPMLGISKETSNRRKDDGKLPQR